MFLSWQPSGGGGLCGTLQMRATLVCLQIEVEETGARGVISLSDATLKAVGYQPYLTYQ